MAVGWNKQLRSDFKIILIFLVAPFDLLRPSGTSDNINNKDNKTVTHISGGLTSNSRSDNFIVVSKYY